MIDAGLRIDCDGAIERVTLDRPAALNALTMDMQRALLSYFTQLSERLDVRVVVLRGAGGNFCAGLDIKQKLEVLDEGPAFAIDFMAGFGGIVLAMRRCPQPILAVLEGVASGGGMGLALAADIRIATPSLRMNAAFAKLGLTGTEMGLSYHLPRLAGAGLAADLMLTARFIEAEEALRAGLVTHVAEPGAIEARADKLVAELIATAPLALRLTKEAIHHAATSGLEAAIALENRNQALAFQSGDAAEGVAAFREKRVPRFTLGRKSDCSGR